MASLKLSCFNPGLLVSFPEVRWLSYFTTNRLLTALSLIILLQVINTTQQQPTNVAILVGIVLPILSKCMCH